VRPELEQEANVTGTDGKYARLGIKGVSGNDMTEDAIDSRLHRRLTRFFEQARLPLRRDVADETPDLSIDCERFERFIERLRAPLDSAEARACTNPWRTAGLGCDEVRVSAALATLWDRRRYGDEARLFLARFLARAGSGFPDETELADGYRVQTEHCLNGTIADRVDITVETRSSIVGIEVKIYAGEGENQLSRYVAAIRTRAQLMRRTRHKVIFLSPYPPKGEADEVAKVDWQTVGEVAAQADQGTRAGWLIAQFGEYCRSLGS